jgi:hypothetical protein
MLLNYPLAGEGVVACGFQIRDMVRQSSNAPARTGWSTSNSKPSIVPWAPSTMSLCLPTIFAWEVTFSSVCSRFVCCQMQLKPPWQERHYGTAWFMAGIGHATATPATTMVPRKLASLATISPQLTTSRRSKTTEQTSVAAKASSWTKQQHLECGSRSWGVAWFGSQLNTPYMFHEMCLNTWCFYLPKFERFGL